MQQVFATISASNVGMVSASELPVDPALRSIVVARGDRSKVATLNAFKQTPPESWPQNLSKIYEQASAAFLERDKSKAVATAALEPQQLLGRAANPAASMRDVLKAFAEAQAHDPADNDNDRPVDPALISAYDVWTEFTVAQSKNVQVSTAKVAEYLWFTAGLAQHHIYTHSSSKEVAELMLGPGAVEEQYVR